MTTKMLTTKRFTKRFHKIFKTNKPIINEKSKRFFIITKLFVVNPKEQCKP